MNETSPAKMLYGTAPHRLSIAQAITSVAVMISCVWLNSRTVGIGFGGGLGLYESQTDDLSIYVSLLALAVNAIVVLGILAVVLRYWPKTEPSWGQGLTLFSFSGLYLWLNNQRSFGVDILYPAWMKKDVQEYGYGFPFSMSGLREWPWSFVVDLAIGLALLRFVEWQCERLVRKPHTPA